MKWVAAVLSTILVSGCLGFGTSEKPPSATEEMRHQIVRVVFPEDGVVCYKYAGGYDGGLSCLPIDQTKVEG